MSRLMITGAQREDEAALLQFIEEHWKAGHVFASHPALFRWQHGCRNDRDLHFVLAKSQSAGEIHAILGYIPTTHFDPALSSRSLFLAIWKVGQDSPAPGLGLALLKWLTASVSAELIVAIGITPSVTPIYRAIGYQVGGLEHHVLFNALLSTFQLASGVRPEHLPSEAGADHCRLMTLDTPDLPAPFTPADVDALGRGQLPRKSWNYLLTRYYFHPVYRYRISLLYRARDLLAVLVWRKITSGDSAVTRVVDLLGDERALAACRSSLQELLQGEQAEYLDIQQVGLSGQALRQAGFVDRHQHPELVVPSHFEPFERRNVDPVFAYRCLATTSPAPIRLLRGDCDTDRPNQLPCSTSDVHDRDRQQHQTLMPSSRTALRFEAHE